LVLLHVNPNEFYFFLKALIKKKKNPKQITNQTTKPKIIKKTPNHKLNNKNQNKIL